MAAMRLDERERGRWRVVAAGSGFLAIGYPRTLSSLSGAMAAV